MRIPLSLIKSFVHIDLSIKEICETLTLLGIEVDAVINETASFSGVIVGHVLSTKKHPNAEKLTLATVSDGTNKLEVVCGAPNCRPGIKTAFAKPGAILTDAQGMQRTIQKASLRGIESHGMLCSATELQLWNDDSGILELPQDWQTGQDLNTLTWDPVFEVSLTPNLGHCLSALGIARELAAATNKPVHLPKISCKEDSSIPIDERVTVEVRDPSLCPKYSCRLIENVKVQPSPFWLQKILRLSGLKPICNVVDITNYIMLKQGQPLHAFDYEKIEGGALQIAVSETTEKFVGLDGIEREISPETLLINDEKKILAIAGVLGGESSAVSDKTTKILLEAAFFDPITIRKGAKKAGIRTDSAIRFEKGVDPEGVILSLDEAACLIAEICGGTIAKGSIDLTKKSISSKSIACRHERVNHLLGTKLSQSEIAEIFHRLGCKAQSSLKEALLVTPPSYRFDLLEEIDLVEEVARLYGYNNIDRKACRSIPSEIPSDPIYLFEKEFRTRAISVGLQEFLTSDLISPRLATLAIEMISQDIELLKALHAKTEEYSILRPSLLPGLLQSTKGNLDKKNLNIAAFEIGRIHFLQKARPVEIPIGAIVLSGKSQPSHWSRKPQEFDFFDLKGLLEELLEGLKVKGFSFHDAKHISFHPGRQANIHANGLIIGSFGEVHPNILEKLDIKQRVLYAELNLQHLMTISQPRVIMSALPQFPSSERDWTIPLNTSTPAETVFEAIQQFRAVILEKVDLIDLYCPEGTDTKNITLRFTYRDLSKTLSHEEVEAVHVELVEKVSKLLAK